MPARLFHRRALRCVVALTAAVGLLAATTASASAKDKIKVHGPTTNLYNTYFNETVSGHASGPANYVISGEQINKGSGCASTYNSEKLRSDFAAWSTGIGYVHGNFSLVAQFYASHLGTHGICSYLIHKSTGKTYAHASLWWTNKQSTTSTGSKLQPAPVGSGQCQYQSYPDGSITAQIAIENTSCTTAGTVEHGADSAQGAAYTSDGFSCSSTTEGAGSPWASAWIGTYYAYSCQNGSQQVAFNWGMHYNYGG